MYIIIYVTLTLVGLSEEAETRDYQPAVENDEFVHSTKENRIRSTSSTNTEESASKKSVLQKILTRMRTEDFLRNFPVWLLDFQQHHFVFTKQRATRNDLLSSVKIGELMLLFDFSKSYSTGTYDKPQAAWFSSLNVGILPMIGWYAVKRPFSDASSSTVASESVSTSVSNRSSLCCDSDSLSGSSSPLVSGSDSDSEGDAIHIEKESYDIKSYCIYFLTNTPLNDSATTQAALRYAIEHARACFNLTVDSVHCFSVNFCFVSACFQINILTIDDLNLFFKG